MLACSGAPLMKKETMDFDDWPIKLGPHLIGDEAQGYGLLFARITIIFPLNLRTLKAIEAKLFTFSLRTIIQFFDSLIDLVF